jgi:predicted kinase
MDKGSCIYLLIGLPGSGKSTWAKKKAEDTRTVIVSRDAIRQMIKAKYVFSADTEPLVKEMAKGCVVSALAAGFDVVIDETNISRSKRKEWMHFRVDCIPLQTTAEYPVVFVWCKEMERNVDLRFNSDARGYSKEKWAEVIEGMKKGFEAPMLEEGAQEIIEVCI